MLDLMRTGTMRHRVEIQAHHVATGDDGGVTENWLTERSGWARIVPLTGSERTTATTVEGPVTHRIEMRYVSGLTSEHRLRYRGRVFHIDAVWSPDELREQTHVMAVEL